MFLQSYVANDVFLQVLCDPACYPYSYVENGEMKGIVSRLFSESGGFYQPALSVCDLPVQRGMARL